MIYIDKYAYFSALKGVKPELKLLLGASALVACIASGSMASYLFVLLFMTCMTVFKAKIPIVYYARLLLLPIGFLVLSIFGLIINFSTAAPQSEVVFCLPIGSVYAFASAEGISLALSLALKSLAAVSCLYFIILTTTIRDIISILNLLNFPPVVITLLTMIYRFIFLLMEIAVTKIKSQQCRRRRRRRHGFAKPGRLVNNLGMLLASVFVQAFISSEWIYKAMQARGHGDSIKFLSDGIHITVREFLLIDVFLLVVIGLNFLT